MGRPRTPLGPIDRDAGALILYTSGTSAQPKGVLHTHTNLGACSRLWASACELGADERVLLTTHMMHVSGACELIIVHGEANVSPQEVEEALCAHPGVAAAGVVGVPDAVWGESVHAVVVLKTGVRASPDELRAFLSDRLADWKTPESIATEPELPIGPTGKVQRRLLRERVLAATGTR